MPSKRPIEYHKIWYEKNREHILAYKREWMKRKRLSQGLFVHAPLLPIPRIAKYAHYTRGNPKKKIIDPKKEIALRISSLKVDIFEEERGLPSSYGEYLKEEQSRSRKASKRKWSFKQ